MTFRPQVFVAMSFADQYKARFDHVFAPAISSITVDGDPLTPYRVDFSKTGDSILTDIMDGIAHSQMVVADISTMGRDSKTGEPYRNGNVMYELGIALACRQPSEVLILQDDNDRFLFDVSTIPHMRLDFTDVEEARRTLHEKLVARLRERTYVHDARVELAIAGLTSGEIATLKALADSIPGKIWGVKQKGNVDGMVSIPRLLDKHILRVVGEFEAGDPGCVLTPLGQVVAEVVKSRLRKFKADSPKAAIEEARPPEQQAGN